MFGAKTRQLPLLRVAVVGLNYAPETTGIAPYTTGFARHLAAGGMDVTAITGLPHYPEWQVRDGYSPGVQEPDGHGVTVRRVGHPVPSNPSGASRVLMELVFAARAGVELVKVRPQVVVVVSPALLSVIPALLLRLVFRYRVGVIVQDLYGAALAETGLSSGLLARATKRLERFLFKRAHNIAVIHDVFRSNLVAEGVRADRIVMMPNWSHITMPETVARNEVREELDWGPDEVIALHAGNMGVKQGLEGLIDVGRLAEHRDSQVRVILLGNGSQVEQLKTYANGLNHVTVMDPLPTGRFEAALEAADCLLLHEKPGVLEMSVPSKLTTYFSAGRPVVAATHRSSGAAALLDASGAGLTVAAGEPNAILEAIEKVTSDPGAAYEMGQNGQRYAAEHLTEDAAMERHQAWVRDLAS